MSETMVETKAPLLQKMLHTCTQLTIPAQAVLELTYRCNLKCIHCYVDRHEPYELTFEEWKDVIDQLKAAGTMYLLFTGGEIMIRPDMLDIARYARSNGFMPGFLTNGTMLTPSICQAIAELKPFSLGLSLYGATETTHESVTGVPGSFRKTLDGIKMLTEAGLVPTVQTQIMKNNLGELEQIKKIVQNLGAKFRINMGMGPSKSGMDYPFQCEPDEIDMAMCDWWREVPNQGKCGDPGQCKAGKAMCSISPQGDVFPCIMFPLKLGNIKETSFESLWMLDPSITLQHIRSITRDDLSTCNSCDLRTYCQRCTGIAYLESGIAEGISTSACRQAKLRWRLSRASEVKI